MQHRRTSTPLVVTALSLIAAIGGLAGACSATNDAVGTGGSGADGGTGNNGQGGGAFTCPRCELNETWVDCDDNAIACADSGLLCSAELGCVECPPGETKCVGNEVVECADDGTVSSTVVETCDTNAGFTCHDGQCKTQCEIAEDTPSNVGCEFWAVDLDQQDYLNDPASAPWGVALSNVGNAQANVTIEINEAAPGQPQQLTVVDQVSVDPSSLLALTLPTREVDCGAQPNDYNAPGTCLSSRAFRITSSAPIVVYQFNVFDNAYSNDASLLLPTNVLGLQYRAIGWNAGHPVALPIGGIDRSYVTIVGTASNTHVTVEPSWRIRGNPPINAAGPGEKINVTLQPFDVLNLETDDATLQEDPKTMADLSGTFIYSDKPIAVFSGVESTGAPGVWDIPTYPGWEDSSCCLDHLEEQLFPLESLGQKYVITRSPVRSTSGYREPDIIRFVGAAETANVTTTLPAPFNSFTLQPGEVRTTYAQDDFIATGDKPFILGQLLISQGYVDGPFKGDPALTTFPPVDQYRNEYVVLTPGGWTENWIVFSAEVGATITIDGQEPAGCIVEPSGSIDGISYESRRCQVPVGAQRLSGDKPFGVTGYGYGNAGSYAFAGGADVKPIYVPPVPN